MNAEIWDWQINQRLRIDYVSYTQKFYHDHGVLRYLVSLYNPWKFTCWNINPYVSNELFIRKNAYSQSNPTGLVGGLHLNQLRIGLNADIIEEFLSTSLYWELRVVKHKPTDQPQWFNIYIIGLAFNFTF